VHEKWIIDGAVRDSQSITADWTPTRQSPITGVIVREVRSVPKENGRLTEIYRSDWNLDDLGVAQVFQVTLEPGGISAWHTHAATTDRLFVTHGLIRIVLFDSRPDSPTVGRINEFRFGEHRPALVLVPPAVFHGIANLSAGPASVLNLVDQAYRYEDPDHWRLPPDSERIPYCIAHGGDCEGRHGSR
jgi:dTDP-4-dehydrorhamnose 3,5-epimerase